MKRLFNKYVIFLVLLLVCEYVSATHLVKRDNDNDDSGTLNTLKIMFDALPGIGGPINYFIKIMQNIYNRLQNSTNGAVGRLLGDILPCTISFSTRLNCTGITTQSSLSDIMKTLLHPVPSRFMPGMMKNIIYMLADGFVGPLANLLIGIPVKQGIQG